MASNALSQLRLQVPSENRLLKLAAFSEITFWDVSTILGGTLIKSQFPLRLLKDVIKLRQEYVHIDDASEYKRCRVQLYGKGILLRDIVKGSFIRTKKQQICRTNDLLVAEIDAKFGGYGIVPPELDGAIVSSHYFLYTIGTNLLLPEYLALVLKCKGFAVQVKATGSTNYAAIRPSQVLDYKIPLPDLKIQKSLVKAYAEKLQRASKLSAAAKDAEANIQSILFQALGITHSLPTTSRAGMRLMPYTDLQTWDVASIDSQQKAISKYPITSLRANHSFYSIVTRGKSPIYGSGMHIILNQKCNRWNAIEIEYAKKVSDEWFEKLPVSLLTQEDDVLINSTGEGTIGRASVITKAHEGLMYDSHLLLLRLNTNEILPEYFVYLFNSSFGQHQVEQLKGAKTTNQTELGVQNLLRFTFPLAPLDVQRNLLRQIDKLSVLIANNLEQSRSLESSALTNFEATIFEL